MLRLTVSKLTVAAVGLALAVAPSLSLADVKPASIFTDHMVLQQGTSVPVWGWADPGEQVSVTLAGQKQTATAGTDGKWMVKLAALKGGNDPLEMTVAGKNEVKFTDVLVGEVWLGSGQSNMEFSLSKSVQRYAGVINEEQEIAAANYPTIRMFTGRNAKTYEPQTAVGGQWRVCSPETVPAFSAVGYFFARDLQKELKVPVGIITLAAGASCAEAWMSREAIASDPLLKPWLDSFDASVKFFRTDPRPPIAEAPKRPTPINKPRTAVTRLSDPVQDQHYPSVQFNGMVAPVIPYAIKGVIWYQGESICYGTPGLDLFGHVNQQLVRDWRKQWQNQNLAFYMVQLPGQQNLSNNPRIREEQMKLLELPHTGLAITIDLGEARDVHPHNKAPVGNRLVKLALADAYGQKVQAQSPMYDSMKVEGNSIRIKLKDTAGGLVAKGGPLKGFVIAGADKNFVEANAKIDGDSIVISSATVSTPIAARYGWDNYPEGMGCNLFSTAELPAAPFRTDTWLVKIEGIVED